MRRFRNPIGGRKHYTVKGYGGDRESEKKLDRCRDAMVVFALVIIGIAIYLLESDLGILEVAKSVVIGIWDMLCDIANACGDFIEYVKHIRSS